MATLSERFRPKVWGEVAGQDKAVALIQGEYAQGRRVFWLAGATGVGKTTCAKLLAADHGGAVTELDCADSVDVAELDSIDSAITFRPLWGEKERRTWIINEAHALKGHAVRRLLGILERIEADPDGRILVIFTTTNAGEEDLFGKQIDAPPLLNRCCRVALTNQGLAKAGAVRIRSCLQAAGMDGQPEAFYVDCMREAGNSIREGWNVAGRRLAALKGGAA